MDRADLLQRLAAKLKQQIAPSVNDEFAKTQAYMASVVLEKLARELGAEHEHQQVKQRALENMLDELMRLKSQENLPANVSAALEALQSNRDASAICALIETLYAGRAQIGEAGFTAMLGAVRHFARTDIDCRMAIAE